MFQVAAAIVYQEEKGKTLLLPKEFYNSHNTLQQEYGHTVFRCFQHKLDVVLDQSMINRLLASSFTQHPGEPAFEDWKPESIDGNVLLHGYFQSYTSLQHHEKTIRELFLQGLKPLLKSYKPSTEFVGIHVRRGDYLKPPYSDVLPLQPLSYYEKALQNFNLQEKTFLLFSDDIEWCMSQELFRNLPHKIFVDEPDECKTLATMTLCHGGFVCANSTFSWWGAFLGAYSLRSPVIAPKDWFKGGVGNLFPSEWIVI